MAQLAVILLTINNRYHSIAGCVVLAKPVQRNSFCVSKDDAINVLPVAFVDTFFGTGGMPVLNLANVRPEFSHP